MALLPCKRNVFAVTAAHAAHAGGARLVLRQQRRLFDVQFQIGLDLPRCKGRPRLVYPLAVQSARSQHVGEGFPVFRCQRRRRLGRHRTAGDGRPKAALTEGHAFLIDPADDIQSLLRFLPSQAIRAVAHAGRYAQGPVQPAAVRYGVDMAPYDDGRFTFTGKLRPYIADGIH